MKKIFSLVLSLTLVLTMIPQLAFAAGDSEDYSGKTVILYTGNLRGDIDQYAKLKTAKAEIANTADAVYLVDAGNYLQGTTYANTTRGRAIYDLMDETGYDVAAMGAYEFAYGDASTGQKWHGNFTKFYTQKMLYEGVPDDFEYARNGNGSIKGTLPAKPHANFKVISSNITGTSAAQLDGAETTTGQGEKLFSFEPNCVLEKGSKKIGFAAQTDSFGLDTLQDGLGNGLSVSDTTALPEGADVIVGLSNDGKEVAGADCTIQAPTEGEEETGALVIDNETKAVEDVSLDISGFDADTAVENTVGAVKENADPKIASSNVTLVGKNTKHRYEESELGDLVTDALLWYAKNAFEGFEDEDVPLVAIQNGGNIRKTIHTGDIVYSDIFNAFPYSPAGVGILYVTGEQLLESLEEANYSNPSNAFPHVAGMTYNIDLDEEYDASTTKGDNGDGSYGNYYLADSYNRVSITSIGGKAFDPKATYAVVADNMVIANGLDTYGTFKAVKNGGAKYINNGNGILVRDVVAQYLQYGCKKKVPAKYAEPQGRITFGPSDYKVKKAAAAAAKTAYETAVKSGTPAQVLEKAKAYKAAADAAKKAAEITCNTDKVKDAGDVVKAAGTAVTKAQTDKDKADSDAKAEAEKKAKEDAMKKVKTVTVNVKTVNAKALDKAVSNAKGSSKYVTKFVLGKKVKKIAKNSFKEYKAVTVLQIKTKKLKKKAVKGSLKGSNVKKIEVKVGSKKANKKIVKKYKKIFTKKNAGKKVKVK